MNTFARLASVLIAASTFVLPLSAMAETKSPAGDKAQKEASFPMKASAFKKIVDGKLGKMKGHFERGVSKRSLSHGQKADIDKTLESALKDIHSAVDKVSSDGVVTKDEAKQVRELSEQLRSKVREELRGKHASAKAKGQKPQKAKATKKSAGKKPAKAGPKADKD